MLIKSWTFNGVPVADAEHHVTLVNIEADKMSFRVEIRAPDAETAFDSRWHGCDYDPDGGAVAAQAEAHLLTLPEYDGAVVA